MPPPAERTGAEALFGTRPPAHYATPVFPGLRLTLSTVLLSAWLILLLAGAALGGAVHLLLLASLTLFPWRAVRKTG